MSVASIGLSTAIARRTAHKILAIGRLGNWVKGEKSISCGPVYRMSRCRRRVDFCYRSDVEARTFTLSAGEHEDARVLLKERDGTKGKDMFDADRNSGSYRWPVLRLSHGSKSEVVLLSDRFFALTTHWTSHTVPCAGDGCSLCELLPARGLFYVAVHAVGRPFLCELGSQSAALFEQHAKLLHGGLRPGQVYELSRTGKKSPVRSECVRFQESVSAVPLITLAHRVLALYRYPGPNPNEGLEDYERRIRALAQRRNTSLADSFLSAKKTGVTGQ